MILLKDRNTYDLHNAEEIMIMQMREQRESQKKWVEKEDLQKLRQRLGKCSGSDHK